jgi:protein-tyrosine phosphatase
MDVVRREEPRDTPVLTSFPVHGRDRHVPFEACFNFRDVGGYETADGHRVRWGAIYRSDSLQFLTAGDQEALGKLGVRTIVDLRSSAELARAASRVVDLEDVAVHHVPLFEEHSLPFRRAELTSPEPPPGETYLAIAAEGGDAFAAAVRSVALGEHAVVFHCAAGRDRTGMLAAIVLSALGVPDETIVADYVLSDRAHEPAVAWAETNAPELAAEFASLPDWLLHASPVVMQAFLDGLRTRHGSIEGYLAAIGVGENVVGTLRRRLLEEPNAP